MEKWKFVETAGNLVSFVISVQSVKKKQKKTKKEKPLTIWKLFRKLCVPPVCVCVGVGTAAILILYSAFPPHYTRLLHDYGVPYTQKKMVTCWSAKN